MGEDVVDMDIHGYINMHQAKQRRHKYVWAAIVVVGFAMALWWSIETLERYIANPISLNMVIQVQPAMDMPEVQVCPAVALNYTSLRADGYSEDFIGFVHTYFRLFRPEFVNFTKLAGILENSTLSDEFEKVVGHNQSLIDNWFLRHGIQCSSFLKRCRMGLLAFDCCSFVIETVNLIYGKCFIFKGIWKLSAQTWAGPTAGLGVELDPVLESAGRFPKLNLYNYTLDGGVLDIRRNFSLSTRSYYPILPKQSTFIALSATMYIRSKTRTGGCLDGVDLNSNECMESCYIQSFTSYCNCTPIGEELIPSGNYPNLCVPRNYQACLTNFTQIATEHNACIQQHCTQPVCREWVYDVSVLNGDVIANNKSNAPTDYALLFVYFPALSYTQITEIMLMPIDTLLSGIGGHFGLFLGASVISIIQLMAQLLTTFASGWWIDHCWSSKSNKSIDFVEPIEPVPPSLAIPPVASVG